MKLPKKWSNTISFMVLAILVAFQMIVSPEAWSIIMALGVALGAVLLATVMPYIRKLIQGKVAPQFKARFALTAIAGQGVAYYLLVWCVETGLLSTSNFLVLVVISVLTGFALTAIANYLMAWFKGPIPEGARSVATFWLTQLLMTRGFERLEAQNRVDELLATIERIVDLRKQEAEGAERGVGLH